MTDPNDQQNPPQTSPAPAGAYPPPPPAAPPTPSAPITLRVIAKDLWDKFGVLAVVVGIGLLIAEFGNLVIDFLGWSSKKTIENTQKSDDALKKQEDAANQQADALVKEATDQPNKEGPVDENWDKKK